MNSGTGRRGLRSLYCLASLAVLLAACSRSPEDHPAEPVAAEPSRPGVLARAQPVARVAVVEDRYHGVTVADPYRWLEDGTDQEVIDWSSGQNSHARAVLDSMPGRATLRARIAELLTAEDRGAYGFVTLAGDRLFALEFDPAAQQPYLVVMGAGAEPADERPLLDPNRLGTGISIDWYRPSHDGRFVAVSLSRSGSELGDLQVYDAATGNTVDDVIERVNAATAGGDLAWLPDDSGFYYTRYPRPGERAEEDLLFYQQVWMHRLGSPAGDDTYLTGSEFPRIAETRLRIDPSTGRLLVWVQDGDSGRFAMQLRHPDGTWQQLSEFGDGHVEALFGPGGRLYVLSNAGAPRGRLLVTDAAAPDLESAEVVLEEGDGVVSQSFYYPASPSILATDERLYVVYDIGGPNEIRSFTLDGQPLGSPLQADVSTVLNLAPAGGSDIVYCNLSYVSPRQWYRFGATDETSTMLAISSETPPDYRDLAVVREFATSKDGTRIPVNIILPPGAAKDGTRPAIATGYGGFGLSMSPMITPIWRVMFENGVVFADANLRGGGEYGEDWHEQGRLTKKQNVFDDFAAVVRYLADAGYADRDRIGIFGASNGGLLMGATLVQHPALAAAVVSRVGIYDMLRTETDPNGQFNIPEYGTVDDPDQFAALQAYSPYHHVSPATRYPPLLLMTGANDARVNPYHSRKFAARLQAAQGGNGMVLLRTNDDTGHGFGTPLDEGIDMWTDQFAFLFHYLDVPVTDRPAKSP